jgi:hypothetical protein
MGTEVQRLATLALDELERLAKGEPLQHEVTLASWDRIA